MHFLPIVLLSLLSLWFFEIIPAFYALILVYEYLIRYRVKTVQKLHFLIFINLKSDYGRVDFFGGTKTEKKDEGA